jgi:formate dehydrogenase major subunit
MTNGWTDIANSDYILVIAGNPAENHPAAYGHITKAVEKGAKLIVVDPRFTRSASKAHIYCPIRSGTDVAFIGGIIRYVLEDMDVNPGKYNMTYVTEYTNASFLVNPNYKGPPDLDGMFSGWDETSKRYLNNATHKYNDPNSTWKYQMDESGIPKKDKTLQDPNCVFQILKKHYARYTPEMVNKITGAPVDKFLEVARTFAESGAVGKSGTLMYAMGATHHTNGAQIIRSYCMLQLLLANIGVCGGGVQAMRGESNVQGSTDMGLLSHIMTGYNPIPRHTEDTLQKYITRITPKSQDTLSLNWWKNSDKYIVSMLKSWWGDAATKDNDFAYNYLPKVHYKPEVDGDENYTHIALFEAMEKGKVKGLMCWGQNPAVGGPNANQERNALAKLDWLVCTDLWETETAAFWKRPGIDPGAINTEVFLLPAAGSYEKEGSVTNSARWMQWRYKAADPPGEAIADLDMMNKLMLKIRALYASDVAAPNREAILNLTWNYGSHVDPNQVAKEVNGYDLTTGKLVNGFANLKNDGTTTCGCWIYCGSYVEPADEPTAPIPGNRASRRSRDDSPYNVGLFSKWAWCWPVNRRILYNRASVDLKGEPFDKEHPVIWWKNGAWTGDVPDGGGKPMAEGGHYPFIMRSEGFGCLFTPVNGPRELSLVDGPLPEHYEPWESPLPANPLSGTKNDPVIKIWRPTEQCTPENYPIVASTYRVVEHWQAGQMTRNLPWLVELMPEMFVEISEELAAEKGIANGDKVIVENTRGSIQAIALVTKRFKPFRLNGKVVHQIGMPWHWGYAGLSTGDSANVLTPSIGDPNTTIPEYKAFLCRIRKA